MSWRIKLPLLLVVFASIPPVVLVLWITSLLSETVESAALISMGALVRGKAEAIEQFTDDRRAEVERMAPLLSDNLIAILETESRLEKKAPAAAEQEPVEQLPALHDAERAEKTSSADPVPAEPALPMNGSDTSPAAEPTGQEAKTQEEMEKVIDPLRQTLGLILWDQQRFEELLVIDAAGRVIVSTFPGHEGRTAAQLEYFQGGIRATYVQPVFVSPITERLTMVIATPIRDDKKRVIGMLAARLNLSRFFRLINDLTGLGETGETLVTKIVSDKLTFMAPTRHDAQAALKAVPGNEDSEATALNQAVRGQHGRGRIVDHRGVCSYAAWRYIPSLDWGLLVKMDCAEATAHIDRAQMNMSLLGGLLVALAILAALLTAGSLVRPLRKLKHAADRISKGDFDVQVDIRSKDEIGELADSFERMVAAIRFFREHSREEDERSLDEYDAPADSEGPASSPEE